MITTRTSIEADVQSDIRDKLGNAAGGISAGDHADLHSAILASAAHITEAEIRVESMALTTPPGSPADRDAYIVGAGATGAWSGQAGKVAIWDDAASAWAFFAGAEGQAIWDRATDAQWRYLSSVWVEQDGGGSGSEGASALGDLSDVDLTTDAPASGDRLEYDGTDWVPVARGVGQPYDISCDYPGTPEADEVILRFVATRAYSLNADFAGLQGTIATNPTGSFVLTVKNEGTTIGTITISTGGSYTLATTSGTAKSFAIGEVLTVVAPSSADATAAGIAFTFLAVTT